MSRNHWPVLLCVALAAGGVFGCRGNEPAPDTTRTPVRLERTGTLPNALRESSGVAASRRYTGVLWSHNDSGDRPRLFAVGFDGSIKGTFWIDGAEAVDWEDLAIGPCGEESTDDCLFIADTGDNAARRRNAVIYVVPEPDPDGGEDTVRVAHALAVRYPQGPVDVEAIAASPNGDLTLFTKGTRGPIRAYLIPGAERGKDTVRVRDQGLLRIGGEPRLGRWVTGAAISPSGRRAAVRTYTEIFLYDRDEAGGWLSAGLPCFLGAAEPLGEAIDFLDEDTMVLTSEAGRSRPGPIHRVRCHQ